MFSCDLCDCEGIVADFENFEDYEKHCISIHDFTPNIDAKSGSIKR